MLVKLGVENQMIETLQICHMYEDSTTGFPTHQQEQN